MIGPAVTYIPKRATISIAQTFASVFFSLQGSERLSRTAAKGTRQKEGIDINGGLFALGASSVAVDIVPRFYRGNGGICLFFPFFTFSVCSALLECRFVFALGFYNLLALS